MIAPSLAARSTTATFFRVWRPRLRLKALRASAKDLEKDYDRTEEDLKALQSCGQIIGEVLRQLDDDRFIVKQLSRVELNAFLADFGPAYFKHARESLDRPNGGGSTCLARILGAYQVATCREGADGEDQAIVDFIVMENLFRGRDVFDPRWLTYDLKGSLRARYNVDDADDDVGDAAADTAARDPGRP